jgi:hypothetical protein
VGLVRQAVALGFRNAAELRKPVYDPLRGEEEFRQLLTDLEGSAG